MIEDHNQEPRTDTAKRDADALYLHAHGLVQQSEMEQAFVSFQAAAELGHNRARIEGARMLLYGIGAPNDPSRAIDWLERAEQAGNVVAGYLLALIAVGNVLLPRDPRIDQRTLAAVRAGYPPAQFAAALHFGRKPDPQDQLLCLNLLGQAAQSGYSLAAQLLAARLRNGEGGPPDPSAADELEAQLGRRGITPLPASSCASPAQAPSPSEHLSLADAWYRPPARILSQQPNLMAIDGLLSADECRLLMATARPGLKQSHTIDPDNADSVVSEIRTSSDASYDPLQEDLALRLVQARMAAAAGLDFMHAEQLIVLRYAPGQQYHPHRDYLSSSAIASNHPGAGNRFATVCVYLNDVEAGGATEFPVPGVRIEPRAGSAIAFRNLTPDGRLDNDTLHAGLPVERGEKWLATLWLRQHRYRDF